MNKQEILKAVLDYIQNEKAKYALLINAPWGAGKTYLYENCLQHEIAKVEYGKTERRSNVYISLYGISNIESLSKELFTNYMLKVKCKENNIKETAYKITSGITSIMSKFVSVSIGPVSAEFKGMTETIIDSVDIGSMVICFDDLERCCIPINDLFGFINNLVEHCKCKVIILADENNIGKMYANMNLEAKYISLLSGKKIIKGLDEKGQTIKNNTDSTLTIEQLKKLNEEIYSENYLYKDIKEKVIGMSLEYIPDLDSEIEDIIKSTSKNENFTNKLIEKKTSILKCMYRCENTNIRIIHTWLIKFEDIFKIIEQYYCNSEYYDTIFDKFLTYSIRIACAIGKNKKLAKWEDDAECGNIKLDDVFLFETEGYRFIDDYYARNELSTIRVCRMAKYIEDTCWQKEMTELENEKRYSHGKLLGKLTEWYYYEDDEVRKMIEELKTEITEDKYVPQNYQNIIKLLVDLKSIELCDKALRDIAALLLEKTADYTEKIEINNFQFSFPDPESYHEFHKYYDPVYDLITQQNRSLDCAEASVYLDSNDINQFTDYCIKNHNLFLQKKTFINYIDLDSFIRFLNDCTLINVYQIIQAIQGVYNFSNLNEFYKDDLEKLTELKNKINELDWNGITRTRAKNVFCTVLSDIISKIKQGENYNLS